jgi:hypothetical protein
VSNDTRKSFAVRYKHDLNYPLFSETHAAFSEPSAKVAQEQSMSDRKFLTAEEVSERYRGGITVGTLRNWRAIRVGPAFVKVGKSVLYPVDELDAWDQKNLVTCRASRRTSGTLDESA